MKTVILAGGFGTRISEETRLIPKPMVRIGSMPVLWHIMKIYSHYKLNDFIICCGYKGDLIKDYFHNYFLYNSDLYIDLKKKNYKKIGINSEEDWKIHLVDTGINTLTAGRIKRIYKYVKNDDFFCCTYGDGLSHLNIKKLISFHKKSKKLATITAVENPSRYGDIKLNKNGEITQFNEKNIRNKINGGFMVFSKKIFDYIDSDDCILEKDVLVRLANENKLAGFTHQGFWQSMDTLREKNYLEDLWNNNKAPWKIWK
jgi:glucose-1-phosphate cytidylyltransferase